MVEGGHPFGFHSSFWRDHKSYALSIIVQSDLTLQEPDACFYLAHILIVNFPQRYTRIDVFNVSFISYSKTIIVIINRSLSFHGEEVTVYVSRIKRKSISTIDIRREETFEVPFRDKISVFY